MGLPHELLPFAENFYRRFPEEFVALGMPGLEQIYDLRTDGTRSRTICETQTEKTIAITIQRWQSPHLGSSAGTSAPMNHPASSHGQAAPYGQTAHYGAWQNPAYAWPYVADPSQPMRPCEPAWSNIGPPQSAACGATPPAQQSRVDHRAVEAQVARLEATIALLRPQLDLCEAAAINQREAQANLANQARSRAPGTPGSAADNVEAILSPCPTSPLRNRRGVKQLQINPPGKPEQSEQSPVRVSEDVQPQNVQPQRQQREPDNNTGAKREAPSRIQPVRMIPSANDPESPRSPGKFSVWK